MIEFEPKTAPGETAPRRDIKTAMLRGLRQKCPACGKGPLYGKYLKVTDVCPVCGEMTRRGLTAPAIPEASVASPISPFSPGVGSPSSPSA